MIVTPRNRRYAGGALYRLALGARSHVAAGVFVVEAKRSKGAAFGSHAGDHGSLHTDRSGGNRGSRADSRRVGGCADQAIGCQRERVRRRVAWTQL